jgi:hypothetical protein
VRWRGALRFCPGLRRLPRLSLTAQRLALFGWIDFYHHARLSADAAEIFRDLKSPKMDWNQQAAAMPTGVFTRSVGMRLAIVGTACLQAHDLELGNRSVDILARVQSSRAKDYVRESKAALERVRPSGAAATAPRRPGPTPLTPPVPAPDEAEHAPCTASGGVHPVDVPRPLVRPTHTGPRPSTESALPWHKRPAGAVCRSERWCTHRP